MSAIPAGWGFRDYLAEPRIIAASNADRSRQFAAKCADALKHLREHPSTHYALASAMDWTVSATWRVLVRLEGQSLIEHTLTDGLRAWVYRVRA